MSAVHLNSWLWKEIGGVLVLGIVGSAAIIAASLAANRRRARSPRQAGLSERSFTDYLKRNGFDPIVAATTYRYLREIQDVRFPILPGDALDWDLGLDEERIGQTLAELARRLDRRLLRSVQLPITVEDLVRTVQASPRTGEAAAA